MPTVPNLPAAGALSATDLIWLTQGLGSTRDRKVALSALSEFARGATVENFPISAGGGGDELEIPYSTYMTIVRCTGGAAYPTASHVTLADMANVPVGGMVLLINQTANFLSLGTSVPAPTQDRVIGCGPGNAMIVYKDLGNVLRAYAFDDGAWRKQLLAPVNLDLSAVFADSIHSPGVVQAVSTLVAAGSYIKIRPVDELWTAFEVVMDLRFNADGSRANDAASFRFSTGILTGKWAATFYNKTGTDSGVANGHVATVAQANLVMAALFDDTAHPGNYGISVSTITWTGLLSSTGAGRMFGKFHIGVA